MNAEKLEQLEAVTDEGSDEAVSRATASGTRDIITSTQYEDVIVNQDNYHIRLSDTAESRNSASMLISKMYAWRGYAGTHRFDDDPNRITLTAQNKGEVVGTITIGIDSAIGLKADETFGPELQAHRERGAKLCEFTKLAFDPTGSSKESLGNLFHLAVIYARDIYHCTDIMIEVNPRHRRFYERMLGFQREGEMKINPRVDAPAYLLRVSLDYASEQILKYGGTHSETSTERSFYPYFFSPREEIGIRNRLLRIDEHAEV